MQRVVAVFVMVAGTLLPATVHGQQRPLVTEDPETIGVGRVLLEAGFELGKDQSSEAYGLTGDVTRIGTFGVSVGVSPNVEFQIDGGPVQRLEVTERKAGAPLARTTSSLAVGDDTAGLEDFVVATKVRFNSESESRPAVGARLGVKLPTADPAKGIGLGTTDFFGSLLIAKTVQSVRTVGNVSLLMLGNPQNGQDTSKALGFGVSVARALTNEFEMVGEINGRLTPFEKIVPAGLESRGVFRLAGRYTYSMLRLDFGFLGGITNRDPSFGISAGATYVITR